MVHRAVRDDTADDDDDDKMSLAFEYNVRMLLFIEGFFYIN